jgi:ABC-type uncharacterized transport system ATPase subunit
LKTSRPTGEILEGRDHVKGLCSNDLSDTRGTQVNNDIILDIKNITKRFPGVTALDDVSVQIRRGEIHGICGENGAGKSTLMKIKSKKRK